MLISLVSSLDGTCKVLLWFAFFIRLDVMFPSVSVLFNSLFFMTHSFTVFGLTMLVFDWKLLCFLVKGYEVTSPALLTLRSDFDCMALKKAIEGLTLESPSSIALCFLSSLRRRLPPLGP